MGAFLFQVTGGLCFRRPLQARPARSPLTPRNPHITHTGPSARAGRRPQARRRPGAGARTTAQELRRGSPPRQGRPAAPARRAVPGSGGTLRSQNNSRVPPPPARDPPRPASLPKKGTHGPSLLLRSGAGGQLPWCVKSGGDLDGGHRELGAERAGNLVARNGAAPPDAAGPPIAVTPAETHPWAMGAFPWE